LAKRITKLADLPAWFDTNLYKAAAQLGGHGWREQLEVRRRCAFFVRYSNVPEETTSKIFGYRPSDLIAAVRKSPIFPYFESDFHKKFCAIAGINASADQDALRFPPGIDPISPHDVGHLMLGMEPERQEEFLSWLDIQREFLNDENRERPPPEYPDWYLEPFQESKLNPIKILGFLPKRLLRKGFDLYLDKLEAPEDSKCSQALRANTYSEWFNCGLLQYLDLAVWMMETDKAISNKVLAAAIFPGQIAKGEENIRKTTKKHASVILEDHGTECSALFRKLSAYAALEHYQESEINKPE
jgi:hypothetical protein